MAGHNDSHIGRRREPLSEIATSDGRPPTGGSYRHWRHIPRLAWLNTYSAVMPGHNTRSFVREMHIGLLFPPRAFGAVMQTNSLTRGFWGLVDKTDKGCWMWRGAATKLGYGLTKMNGRTVLAHRASYIHHRGEIEKQLVLDHLCRNRKCVNPEHLEPVTQKENVRRGAGWMSETLRNPTHRTHCDQGHQWDETNTIWRPRRDGRTTRLCRACRDARNKSRSKVEATN